MRDFKEAQKVEYADLPHPDPWEEVAPWGECKSLGDVAAAAESGTTHVPHVTLLRCALTDLAAHNKSSTADDVFEILFSTDLPSLLNIDDAYQVCASTSFTPLEKKTLNGWHLVSLTHVLLVGVAVENTQ